MGLLEGKRLLITGVLNEVSIAFATARLAQQEGAEILLTGFGRGMGLTEHAAQRLDPVPDVLEFDASVPEHYERVAGELKRRWGRVDGVVHSIAYAPPSAIGGGFLEAPWEDVAVALRVSSYSLAALGAACAPLLAKAGGGAMVGLTFDGSVAWPAYDWMGVAKASLESTCRYLARDLGEQGTRVNLVSSGPIHTLSAMAVDSVVSFDTWQQQAPLHWDTENPEPVGRVVCALLSDWTPTVTGEIVHADGGVHAMGSGIR